MPGWVETDGLVLGQRVEFGPPRVEAQGYERSDLDRRLAREGIKGLR